MEQVRSLVYPLFLGREGATSQMIEKTSTGKYRVRVDMGRGRSWEILCNVKNAVLRML